MNPPAPAPIDTMVDDALTLEPLQRALQEIFAPWVRRLGLIPLRAGDGEVVVRLPIAPDHVHAGGVLCGQTMMASADTAMVLAMMTKLRGFQPMTTVQLQTSFLRPVPKDASHLDVHARVLRAGKTLAFGDIQLLTPDGALAAHATTTYALLAGPPPA